MADTVNKLAGLKCPECGKTGSLRMVVAEDGAEPTRIICPSCEELDVELDDDDLVEILCGVLETIEGKDDPVSSDIMKIVVDTLSLG